MARSGIVNVTIEQVTCTTDADCEAIYGPGYTCQGGVCVPTTIQCVVDADCPKGFVCKNNVCVPAEGIPPWLIALVGGTILIGTIIVIYEMT